MGYLSLRQQILFPKQQRRPELVIHIFLFGESVAFVSSEQMPSDAAICANCVDDLHPKRRPVLDPGLGFSLIARNSLTPCQKRGDGGRVESLNSIDANLDLMPTFDEPGGDFDKAYRYLAFSAAIHSRTI